MHPSPPELGGPARGVPSGEEEEEGLLLTKASWMPAIAGALVTQSSDLERDIPQAYGRCTRSENRQWGSSHKNTLERNGVSKSTLIAEEEQRDRFLHKSVQNVHKKQQQAPPEKPQPREVFPPTPGPLASTKGAKGGLSLERLEERALEPRCTVPGDPEEDEGLTPKEEALPAEEGVG
ncbi:hypothetical protein BHE74_00001718 [Ensete ventricosum]|nr:hypothetical protein BHE74_00001718 [Ensete ventricosum]